MNHSPTYAYRFDDEAAAQAVFTDTWGENLPGTPAVDVIGILYHSETGEPQDGWHVNISAPVPGWEAYQVFPKTLKRVFA